MSELIVFLRLEDVLSRVGMSRSLLYRMVRGGQFPKPVKTGVISGWVESEVIAWQKAKMAERERGTHGKEKR